MVAEVLPEQVAVVVVLRVMVGVGLTTTVTVVELLTQPVVLLRTVNVAV